MILKKRPIILVAPLEWGLGHATRCIPIIKNLIGKDAKVILAADGFPAALLKQEFPELELIKLPGYEITYPKNGNMVAHFALQAPGIIKRIQREHQELENLIQQYNINAVISDNRFGLWSKDIPCVFITHQLGIQSPFFESIIRKINYNFIEKYNWCWVPDVGKEPSLSGKLAHLDKLPNNVRYIGPLSRFSGNEQPNKSYEVVATLSGPEPQRTLFENLLIPQLETLGQSALLLQGKAGENFQSQKGKLTIKSHLPSTELEQVLLGAKTIICRSGYSSIMDLAILEKSAILIPTPGQTEQEYLAKYHQKAGNHQYFAQQEFKLTSIPSKFQNKTIINHNQSEKALSSAIVELLECCR